jgi:hypothetical protein
LMGMGKTSCQKTMCSLTRFQKSGGKSGIGGQDGGNACMSGSLRGPAPAVKRVPAGEAPSAPFPKQVGLPGAPEGQQEGSPGQGRRGRRPGLRGHPIASFCFRFGAPPRCAKPEAKRGSLIWGRNPGRRSLLRSASARVSLALG